MQTSQEELKGPVAETDDTLPVKEISTLGKVSSVEATSLFKIIKPATRKKKIKKFIFNI